MTPEFKDYYGVLGVAPEASATDIKRAYRTLARKYHPDVSKLPDTENKFKEVNEAWEVLKDPEKKAQYDSFRKGERPRQESRYQHSSQGAAFSENDNDFSEFFNSIFGGANNSFTTSRHRKTKGQDIHAKLQVPLTMAYEGGVQTIQLQLPRVTSEGRQLESKNLKVKIPAGVTQGSQIRLKEQGSPGTGGGPAGDLYVEIHLNSHPYFSVHHKDIHLQLPITPWEAALGATLAVPTLGGSVNLKISPMAQSGQKLRLKGRGLPGQNPGDQYVILQIMVPKPDSDKAKALYEEMAKTMPFNPREKLGA